VGEPGLQAFFKSKGIRANQIPRNPEPGVGCRKMGTGGKAGDYNPRKRRGIQNLGADE
jgi:hypothetical protein